MTPWASRLVLTVGLTGVAGTAACGGLDASPDTAVGAKSAENKKQVDHMERMFTRYHERFPTVREITVEELRAVTDPDRFLLVDVRTPEEQQVSMIPGAVTRAVFEEKGDAFTNRTVVAYCTAGYRSGQYAEELQKKGVEVLNLRGSILAWCQAGLPLETTDGKPTRRVHVYGKRWNILPDEYEPVF